MKTKNTVGLFGKFHVLLPKLNVDLASVGFSPFVIDHRKLFWKQYFEGRQKGHMHPVPWEDLSQILSQCVNRPEVLSKTFTVHAIAGEPEREWDRWFEDLESDTKQGPSARTRSA
jgi:hypothetical protein